MAPPPEEAPPAPSARSRGRDFELAAEQHLAQHGLTLVTRNHHCRGGEIDLVMRDGRTLVFVEVRYRRSSRYGSAAESVDRRKQARIVRAAQHFLLTHRQYQQSACRFDVLAIEGEGDTRRIDWIKGAFSA